MNKLQDFTTKINTVLTTALEELNSGKVKQQQWHDNYLSKGGILPNFFRQLTSFDAAEKKVIGGLLNQWKQKLVTAWAQQSAINQTTTTQIITDSFLLPGKKLPLGNRHPLSQISEEIYTILDNLGFQIVATPEVENEDNNFNKLNLPADHPARGMQDTFYLNHGLLLRTHTSNTQIRIMSAYPNQPLKVATIGKVYRRDDDDATHTHQFMQLEGFVVGEDISFAHLKGTIEAVLHQLFGTDHPLRFRPSYFPFTEPSVEVDAGCVNCQGKGCNVCKQSGWVEVLGAGLINPQVLVNCGFDQEKFTGLAFGMGIERLLMIKHGIEDIRNFYNNDLRFLKQFN